MSNSQTMDFILKKFPIQEKVKWSEHLYKMKDAFKERKFPEFIKWLEESGALWELLAAQSKGARPGGRSNFYGGREGGGQ